MLIKLILLVFLLLSLVCTVPTTSQTGLPARIVHRESGIKLVLIPAGRFQMGSPESEPDRGRGEGAWCAVVRGSMRPIFNDRQSDSASLRRDVATSSGFAW